MHILKFGGTSMSDAKTWRRVVDIIKNYEYPFVVVSATARTTRKLIAAAEDALDDLQSANKLADEIRDRHRQIVVNFLAKHPQTSAEISEDCESWIEQITDELKDHLQQINQAQDLPPQRKDAVASLGECLSSFLFSQCGQAAGLPTTWVDAAEVIRTDSDFGQASPNTDLINRQAAALIDRLGGATIPIMGGYYGQDEHGNTTTLGFEGSDYSASLVGAALSAEAIEIWTDVSGIYTCDPRLIPDARPIPQLSFQEATELAYFGAKVLHPSTTKPASQKKIPVWVKNIFEADEPGTCISKETQNSGRIKAITFKENCSVITVTSSQTVMGYEFLAEVFDILRWHHLPVDVVTTTEASVSIAIENDRQIEPAVEKLGGYGTVDVLADQGIISLVGCNKNGTQSLVNEVLADINSDAVNLISFSQSKGNLNIVLEKDYVTSSVKTIHERIFDKTK